MQDSISITDDTLGNVIGGLKPETKIKIFNGSMCVLSGMLLLIAGTLVILSNKTISFCFKNGGYGMRYYRVTTSYPIIHYTTTKYYLIQAQNGENMDRDVRFADFAVFQVFGVRQNGIEATRIANPEQVVLNLFNN